MLTVAAGYMALLLAIRDDSPSRLIACMESEQAWLAWTCKMVLHHVALGDDQVAELNAVAGATYAIYMEDAAAAEETLALFMSRGVDIDARNEREQGWTALHAAAVSGEVTGVRLLLANGARADLSDAGGRTPLQLAQLAARSRPDDQRLAEVIQILTAVQSAI